MLDLLDAVTQMLGPLDLRMRGICHK